MGYKILGWVVFKGAKWYVRRRLGGSAKVAAAGAVAVAVVGLAVAGARRAAASS